MSEFKTVARPYAKAAFDFAVEKNDVDRWLNMLNFASEVVKIPQIHDLILSDAKPEIISKMIIDVCDEQLDEYGQNFVRILAENQRLTLLPVILYSFIEYHAMKESFVEVDVTSALALSEAQKMNITQSMEKRLSRKVKLDCKIDKSIVAGIIIRSGDMVIDGSIRGRLERLTDTLQS